MNASGPEAYLTTEELSDLERRFTKTLEGNSCLVFWTGLPRTFVEEWADSHKMKTLSATMGPSFSEKGPGSLRHGKRYEAWSMVMKGASALFARHACRHRQVVVVTRPPPDIYSDREESNYRTIEEPILKGLGGGASTLRIDLVHPTVPGAEDFRYEIWPVDSCEPPALPDVANGTVARAQYKKVIECCRASNAVTGRTAAEQAKAKNPEHDLIPKVSPAAKKELKQRRVQQETEAKRRKAELERRHAREEKGARQRELELREQQARENEEAQRGRAELKQRQAQMKKEAKHRKAVLEQREKDVKRQKTALQQLGARERKEINRLNDKLDQVEAQKRKEAKKEAKKEAHEVKERLDQWKAQDRRRPNRHRQELEQLQAQAKREAKQRKVELKRLELQEDRTQTVP